MAARLDQLLVHAGTTHRIALAAGLERPVVSLLAASLRRPSGRVIRAGRLVRPESLRGKVATPPRSYARADGVVAVVPVRRQRHVAACLVVGRARRICAL